MRRFTVLVAVAGLALWVAASAFSQADDEWSLPPVKLRPDRPSEAEPIPPAPDEREAPAEPAPAPEPLPEPAPEPAPAPEPMPAPEPAPAPAPEPMPAPVPEPGPAPEPSPAPAPEPMPAPPPAPVPEPVPAPEPMPAPEPAPAPEPVAVTTPAEPVPAPRMPTEMPAAPAPVAVTPKPEEIQAEAVEAQIEPEPETDFTGMQELGLVEEVARLRKAYGRSLLALKDYYLARGAQHKIEWVEQELKAFEATPKIRYLTIAEVVGPELKPLRRIAAADQLYKEGMDYKNYPAFPPAKKDYLKNALDKFQAIIEKYPESDKIDDAAFRMGEIYGGWYCEDWARAVQCYERCWQWDPETQYAARFNAAKIYEERLKNRIKAVELYNAVLLKSRNPDEVNQARDRIKALTGK